MNGRNSIAVSVKSLSLRIQDTVILDDISFEVPAGGTLSIIGPNGAGKTSLLRCIGRMTEPTSGEIRIQGDHCRNLRRRELARRVGYVPQAGDRTLPYSVREFVLMARYPYFHAFAGPSRNDLEAVDNALDITGTDGFADRKVATLSGGERQKVLIAAALAQQTPVLLLDEPTSFLDYRHEVDILDLIDRLNRESGRTVITVTHDLNSGVFNAGLILGLAGGRQIFLGAARDLEDPDVLESIYGIPFEFLKHPYDGSPVVLPARRSG
ncbi:ABC transporter ATP-binding protein [bacterium]|nr:ABC transporter ATP-binding protein [candidate division CSSED10-310 bacterium]